MKGIWEFGLGIWEDHDGGLCIMGDDPNCNHPKDEEGMFEMVINNFNKYYESNRAPFGLFYHADWFDDDYRKRAYLRVIDEILKRKDVFFMTKWQAIQWIRNPKPIQELCESKEWQCPQYNNRPPPCLEPNKCDVVSSSGQQYFNTCQACPQTYLWI